MTTYVTIIIIMYRQLEALKSLDLLTKALILAQIVFHALHWFLVVFNLLHEPQSNQIIHINNPLS